MSILITMTLYFLHFKYVTVVSHLTNFSSGNTAIDNYSKFEFMTQPVMKKLHKQITAVDFK